MTNRADGCNANKRSHLSSEGEAQESEKEQGKTEKSMLKMAVGKKTSNEKDK